MKKTSAKQWAKRVQRWQRSGLPAKAYGQRHGIDPKQLTWWKWRLKTQGELLEVQPKDKAKKPQVDNTAIRLLPVRVVHEAEHHPEAPRCAVVEVGLRNGRVVRVAQDADLGWLAELLAVVEAGGGAGC